MASNGHLLPSELSPIPGGELENSAADAWNSPGGPADNGCRPGGPLSSYRTFDEQIIERNEWCAKGMCGNAAVPGESNHGWGHAVDDPVARAQRWLLEKGSRFGWVKNEAPTEAWHFTYIGGGHVHLRRHDSGPWVRIYRRRLKRLGYRLPGDTHRFGPLMERAVKAFQKRHHLPATGVIDGKTAYHINRRLHEHH